MPQNTKQKKSIKIRWSKRHRDWEMVYDSRKGKVTAGYLIHILDEALKHRTGKKLYDFLLEQGFNPETFKLIINEIGEQNDPTI